MTTNTVSPNALGDLAHAPTAGRNRAVDALRVMAMSAVVIGHWIAADVRLGDDGKPTGGNALADLTSMHWLTWLFQVMPLFFCVGGFANSSSLDSSHRKGMADRTWIALRLRRLLAPVSVFMGAWLVIVGVAYGLGAGSIGSAAAKLATIPLWFMAVYVLDIALAPTLRRLWLKHGFVILAGLAAAVASLDIAHQAGVSYIETINVFIGWSTFQVLGMAWHAGALCRSHLFAGAVAGFGIAIGAVAFGPWPVSMVQVPGAELSNTWPPTLALLAFGLGQCSIAMLLAPKLDAFLQRSKTAWKLVIVASSMAMSVYLWHLSAMAAVGALAWAFGLLPSAAVGTTGWFAAKLPIMAASAVLLALVVSMAAKTERRSLLDTRSIDMPAKLVTLTAIVGVVAFKVLMAVSIGHIAGAVGAASLVGAHVALQRFSAKAC
jgi:hypothetical protein